LNGQLTGGNKGNRHDNYAAAGENSATEKGCGNTKKWGKSNNNSKCFSD